MGESAGKTTGYPTSEQIDAAKAGGFVLPTESARPRSFDQYGDAAAPSGPDMSALIGWVVGAIAVLVVVALIVTLVIVITIRRRKAGEGTHS